MEKRWRMLVMTMQGTVAAAKTVEQVVVVMAMWKVVESGIINWNYHGKKKPVTVHGRRLAAPLPCVHLPRPTPLPTPQSAIAALTPL